jgi:CHAD domain-containing protein
MSETHLGSPAGAAVGHLLLESLAAASRHAVRLGDVDDDEAVHDSRVAVRRLRTFLRAYSGAFPVDDQIQLDLRELTGLTNATRDGEAHVEWLRDRQEDPALSPAERRAVATALARLDARVRRPEGLDEETRRVLDRAGRALADLQARDAARSRGDGQRLDQSFGQVTAAVLDHEALRLRKRLGRIESLDDARRIHRARLSGKRLRYVLEQTGGQVRDSYEPLERLKTLQDSLGELHDLSGLDERLAEPETDLRGVVLRRRAELFESLSDEWLGTHGDGFFAELARITRTLREEPS